MRETALLHGIEIQELTGRSRHKAIADARKTLVFFCTENTRHTQQELANTLGISEAAISKMLGRRTGREMEGVEKLKTKLIKVN